MLDRSRARRGPLAVAVVDGVDYMREGVARDLRARPARYGPVTTYAALEHLPILHVPALVILEPNSHLSGRSTPAIPELVAAGATVVLFTTEERPVPLRRAVHAGISGLALKHDGSTALHECLAELPGIANGELACGSARARHLATHPTAAPHLSARLVDVLEHLADGLTRQQAATRMGITEITFSA